MAGLWQYFKEIGIRWEKNQQNLCDDQIRDGWESQTEVEISEQGGYGGGWWACWDDNQCLADQVDEVAYVDKQRNIAISLGERDVKADVKAKNK